MRNLSPDEIRRLEANGCRCRDWSRVTLRHDSFNPDEYAGVWFSGDVQLGVHTYKDSFVHDLPPILNTHIADSIIGDNVVIRNNGTLANLIIGSYTNISNCKRISYNHRVFGENTDDPIDKDAPIKVNVLDETGSRKICICPGMTAQMAFMAIVNNTFRLKFNKLSALSYPNNFEKSVIGSCTTIENCDEIDTFNIGEGCHLSNVARLHNCIIGNYSKIGTSAILEKCIVETDSNIDNGSQLTNCFVGQNVTLSNFTAQHSLFFANSHLCNGEAVSVFAGPFTVSEHKSTLLIGGEFMMFNAGSGTNQSNHLYKLGPIHSGKMGRGCKCASDSYVMWPARIGDFTMVSGRHYNHPVTGVFPFSYLIGESDGSSRLLPGENLGKCGTARDIAKWPQRDRRDKEGRLDIINFDALNPAVVNNMKRALFVIDFILNRNEFDENDDIHKNGVIVSRHSLRKAKGLYTNALMRYFGERLLKSLMSLKHPSDAYDGNEVWFDVAGMIMPDCVVKKIFSDLINGSITSVNELAAAIESSREEIEERERTFVFRKFPRACLEKYGLPARGKLNIKEILPAYVKAEEDYLAMVLADAAKEAKMAGRQALVDDDPTLNALKKRIEEIKEFVSRLLNRE